MNQDKTESLPLTFSWAKDNGVILSPADKGYQLICRNSASLDAILEGNRGDAANLLI